MAIPRPTVVKNEDGSLQRVMTDQEADGGRLDFQKILALDNDGKEKEKYCFVWLDANGNEKNFLYPTWIPNGRVIIELLFKAAKQGWFTPGEEIK